MKEEIKNKWVEALRSGQYEQVRLGLSNTIDGKRGYCSLGVLCELYGKDPVNATKPLTVSAHDLPNFTYYLYDGQEGTLPDAVLRWAGASSKSGSFRDEANKRYYSLVEANDSGKTFAEIADIIERYWKEL